MKIKQRKNYLTIIISIYLLYIFLSGVNSQETQISEMENKLKEFISKFNETNNIFKNISQKMENIKYNFILKIKYNILKSKNEKILEKINYLKTYFNTSKIGEANLVKELYNLNEHLESYATSCYKTIKLHNSFKNLNTSIITLIKIFSITLIIIFSFASIIFIIMYIYRYRKRKSYELLKEEFNHSSFRNINDSEYEKFDSNKTRIKK